MWATRHVMKPLQIAFAQMAVQIDPQFVAIALEVGTVNSTVNGTDGCNTTVATVHYK